MRYWYTDGHAIDALCERHGLERSAFHRLAARMACALPDVDDGTFGAWCIAGNATLKRHPPQPGAMRQGQGGSLRPPKNTKDKMPRTVAKASVAVLGLTARTSVIHQVKGEEADAVLVILPDDDRTVRVVDAWISGTHDLDLAENLRVLYVAATRARRLLALELPDTVHDKLRAHFESEGVPVVTAIMEG